MSDKAMISAFMAVLVKRAGGVDAVAAIISAATGEPTGKGTISKRLAGQLSWPAEDIWALEDALGDHCVSRFRTRQLPAMAEGQDLMTGVADAAREHGEAVSAVMALVSGKGSRDQARKEVDDAIASIKRLGSIIEGGTDA